MPNATTLIVLYKYKDSLLTDFKTSVYANIYVVIIPATYHTGNLLYRQLIIQATYFTDQRKYSLIAVMKFRVDIV